MTTQGPVDVNYQWETVLAGIKYLFNEPFTTKVEKLMLKLLRLGEEVLFADSSELPHSMSPEDMLKSLAVQWLSKNTGATHLQEMQRIEATTKSPALASIVRAVLRKLASPTGENHDTARTD